MKKLVVFIASIIILLGLLSGISIAEGETESQAGAIVQFGKMHEAIGQKEHQARVRLSNLTKRPHFFAVAALERLQGEATIYDGEVTVTTVDKSGRLQSGESESSDHQAAMLVGDYISSWSEFEVAKEVPADGFDDYIASMAKQAGLDIEEPFVFCVEGEFITVDMHVINGACPIHARMKKIELDEEVQPFETELPNVSGKLVGVFANDAVGKITHPATSTHVHLLYTNPKTGKTVTGHVEKIGLQKGSVLRLPMK